MCGTSCYRDIKRTKPKPTRHAERQTAEKNINPAMRMYSWNEIRQRFRDAENKWCGCTLRRHANQTT